MQVGILGIGAIGGILAALLHRNGHNPICICREKTNDLISSSGLKLDSKIYGDYNFCVNKKVLNNDEQSDSLKTKIDQIETQLDVLIDDAKTAKEKVIVANEDFIQLSNSMAVNDKILKNLNSEIKGAVKEIKEVKNMTELQNRKLYISE